MNAPDADYYTSLGPFRDRFASGLPILTWHKLGPRPRGVRLKGLYLSRALFGRQLAELRAAGFQSVPLETAVAPPSHPDRHVVLTFDDGYVSALAHGLPALGQGRFHAIQFLVAERLGGRNDWDEKAGEAGEPLMDAAQVRLWLAAGHEIGSHSLTHPYLTRIPPGAAREEVFASKRRLEDLFGQAIHHFCYPYGDWDPAVRDLVMAAGYHTACTTEAGINRAGADRFALKRFTARYRSRSWKSVRAWVRHRRGGST